MSWAEEISLDKFSTAGKQDERSVEEFATPLALEEKLNT
jgi:hypothetical protein